MFSPEFETILIFSQTSTCRGSTTNSSFIHLLLASCKLQPAFKSLLDGFSQSKINEGKGDGTRFLPSPSDVEAYSKELCT